MNEHSFVFSELSSLSHFVDKYQQYQEKVAPMIAKYGGRYLVRSGAEEYNISPAGNIIRAEGDWKPDRVIVLKYPSLKSVIDFGTSAEYLAIKHLRTEASTTKSVLVNEYK